MKPVVVADSILTNPWLVTIVGGIAVGLVVGLVLLEVQARKKARRKVRRTQTPAEGRSLWWWGAGAGLIGLAAVVGAYFGLKGIFDGDFSPDAPKQRVTIGEPAQDGPYVFTVMELKCGLNKLSAVFPTRPQGQYCTAQLRVVNRGDEASHPVFGVWILHVGTKRYPATEELGQAFSGDIFPDAAAEGRLVFDIPQQVEPSAIELRHEFGSPGILVLL